MLLGSKFLAGKVSSKIYDVYSKDNHKICTQVVVPLLKCMSKLWVILKLAPIDICVKKNKNYDN